MPFGPWDSFQDCLDEVQAKQGYDDETARKVCGALKAKLEDRADGSCCDNCARADGEKDMTKMRAPDPAPPSPLRMQGQLTSFNPYDRSVGVVASTPQAVNGEAITSWDLERFLKNPIACWDHLDPANGIMGSLPIGKVTNLAFDPDPVKGLTGRIVFARAEANPLAANVCELVRDDMVRAVSVQFEYLGDGRARLLELSFVPIGADENAGTDELNPNAGDVPNAASAEETMSNAELKRRISDAAASLARHRARLKRQLTATRADAADAEVERMDRVRISLDKMQDTPSGGKKIPARVARTGVLVYRNPDGSERRELRLPTEQFRDDVMETLDHAPVVDIAHHNAMVTAETWKQAALGSVGAVRADGDKYLAANLYVNDKDILERIQNGERTEISLGYRCRVEPVPDGIYREPGSPYDGVRADYVQRDLRFNHAALCPPNRGRAGSDVGLRLDKTDDPWAIAHLDDEQDERNTPMADTNAKTVIKIRLDGREMEEFSKEHFDAVESGHKKAVEKITSDATAAQALAVAEVQKRLDSVSGAHDALKTEIEQLRADAAKKPDPDADEDDDSAESMKRGLKLAKKLTKIYRQYMRMFGLRSKDEETKMDAVFEAPNPVRALMIHAIQQKDPRFDGKDSEGKERSLDYVEARYDTICASASQALGIKQVREVVETETQRVDSLGEGDLSIRAMADQAVKEQKEMIDRLQKQVMAGVPGK